jgi:toxin ParE1/3/4
MQSVLLKWTDLAELDLEKIEANIAEDNSQIIDIDAVMKVIDNVDLILPEHPRAGR